MKGKHARLIDRYRWLASAWLLDRIHSAGDSSERCCCYRVDVCTWYSAGHCLGDETLEGQARMEEKFERE